MFETIIVVLMLMGGQAYVDVPYKGYPHIKALFLNEYQCNQVKTKDERCVRLDKEYVGLLERKRND